MKSVISSTFSTHNPAKYRSRGSLGYWNYLPGHDKDSWLKSAGWIGDTDVISIIMTFLDYNS